jgi:hypothetical protein
LTFEDLNKGNGFVLYSRVCKEAMKGILTLDGLRDYALVFIDGKKVAELNRYYKKYSCSVEVPKNAILDILVENMGRINYGSEIVHNTKGIIGPVMMNGVALTGPWQMYTMPFEQEPDLRNYQNINIIDQPTFYQGTFTLEKTGDTFLDFHDWGKGIVFVNGHHLGRFWSIGPQQTLYLPGCWLKKGTNDISIFEMQNHVKHQEIKALSTSILDQLNTKTVAFRARYDGSRKASLVTMIGENGTTDIYYTLDGSEPTLRSNQYNENITIDKSVNISARGFRNGVGSEVTSQLGIEPSRSTGKVVTLVNTWSEKYPGEGIYTLVDGIRGNKNYHEGNWQGYEGVDLNAALDLGSETTIKRISLGCLQDIGSWIFLPDTVEVLTSSDGKTYSSAGLLTHQTVKDDRKNVLIKDFSIVIPGIQGRYIKVRAKNIGTCPPWHPGAGGKAWLFVDEISVN